MILIRRVALVSFALSLSFAIIRGNTCSADLIYFVKGGRTQVAVKREGDKVSLLAPGGSADFLKADFQKISDKDDPASEWRLRDSASRKIGLNDRFASAWWALENGLTAESVASLREIHAAEATHEPTASLLRSLDKVSGPLTDPQTRAITEALQGSFQEVRSPHFLFFHQMTEAAARERLELLEQVYTTFYLDFAGQGFDLSPPRNRLVVAEFRNKDDYLAFLNRGHARAFSATQGYYHPTLNLVVSFDPSDRVVHRNSLAALERRRQELLKWETSIERMPQGSRLRIQAEGEPIRTLAQAQARLWLDATRRDLARLSLLLRLELQAFELGMAAHETTHQLIANSGLTRRHDDFPTWLHEGLASQFEVVRGGRWAGVSRAHDLRLPEWRSIHPAPRIAPILRDQEYGQGYHRDLYAQAWSLVYYLRQRRPKEFASFLDLLRAPTSRPTDRATGIMDTFRSCFGADLSQFEADWHLFMKSVKTPLEAEDPANISPKRHELPLRSD